MTDNNIIPPPPIPNNQFSVTNRVESILTHKVEPDGTRMYLVKIIGQSYNHLEWVPPFELLKTLTGRSMIKTYNKLYPDKPPDPPFFDSDYTIPERIIAERNGKYLIKWKSLDYESTSWENIDEITEEDIIQEFKERTRFPSPEELNPDVDYTYQKVESLPTSKSGFSVRNYQLDGLNFLMNCWCNHRNAILADEMGLGKTLQVSVFLNTLNKLKKIRGPFLIIVPLSTIGHWEQELEEWTDLHCTLFCFNKYRREICKTYEFYFENTRIPIFQVLLTTYDYITRENELFSGVNWEVIVCDEAHKMKNSNSKLMQNMKNLKSKFKLLLTGTPIQNSTPELWSLLNYINPEKFESLEEFQEKFGTVNESSQISQLNSILKPIMLRRVKSDVEKSLTPIEEIIIECKMTDVQKYYYRSVFTRNTVFLLRGTEKKTPNFLMNITMELRKVCNHPYLIQGAEENIMRDLNKTGEIKTIQDGLIRSCGKMILLDKLLDRLLPEGHRVLIFSQFTLILDIIQDYLNLKGIKYVRLDGNVRGPERQAAIDNFSRDGSDIPIFLLTTRAGGQGINLTAADTVIIYDSDWNPQNDIQATARCHRIGQTKSVKVYRFLTSNSYERSMFDIASRKLGLDHAVLEGSSKERSENLDKLLRLGAYYQFYSNDSDDNKFASEDIDDIIAHSQRIRHESVFGGEGSTFSNAQFEVNEAELEAPSFWKKLLVDIGDDDAGESIEQAIADSWTKKKFKRLRNTFFDFGYGRWKRITEQCGSNIQINEAKSICRIILKWLLEVADDPTDIVHKLYNNQQDDEYSEKFNQKYRSEFSPLVTKNASLRIERIEVLHCLNCATKSCSNAPEGLVLPNCPGELPSDTWSSEDDRQLLYGMWQQGVSSYFRADINQKNLLKRLNQLIHGWKSMFLHYSMTSPDPKLFTHNTLLEASNYWKIEEHNAVINTLIDYGFTNANDFMNKARINKVPDCVSQYVKIIYDASRDDSCDQAILKKLLSSHDSQLLIERKTFFAKLRKANEEISDPQNDDERLLVKVCKFGLQGCSENGQTSSIVKRLNDFLKNSNLIEKTNIEQIKLPKILKKSMNLISLGKVVWNRPGFHSERYLYPDGFKTERKYISVINPKDRVWYISEIIDDGKENPLFRVSMRDMPEVKWEGRSASKVWSEVLKAVNKKRKEIGDLSKNSNSISGPDHYGLSNPLVLKYFSQMENIDKLKSFVPTVGQIKEEEDEFVIDFAKLFARARELKGL
ncbi:F/Y-rich N-terminus family protein [Trichomonas vaginalis G3]|uniref:F/Y-rich N-terminus family protein n=1 Tax=Trichomonas vaginalis (strain ATCC PRA-98 / G3) TaxID=412133 RepID=A2DTG9_TRIV3|nr:histone methyltransferase activity (H3-K4 specific) [Trichomonas vaginalis G3]EAY16278.1 F/Y-rich N-terminus family protein [Trichomonas vaginalis G3]KAI5523428.1 histone methyltransferase activity (H3-K4 specific) [Trichomonas vaginalis G3]|eukprot:XP_001328501.1 F/Y-rich N-terminus family protein [Trichomonas vaginalis G3]